MLLKDYEHLKVGDIVRVYNHYLYSSVDEYEILKIGTNSINVKFVRCLSGTCPSSIHIDKFSKSMKHNRYQYRNKVKCGNNYIIMDNVVYGNILES